MKKTPSLMVLSALSILILTNCQTAPVERVPAQNAARMDYVNASQAMGIPPDFKANQTVVADLNDDGYADLILTEWHVAPVQTKIFLNENGKKFKDVPITGFAAGKSAVLKMAKGLFTPGVWGVVVRYPNSPLQTFNLRITKAGAAFEKVNALPAVVSNWGDVQIYNHDQDARLDILATSYYNGANTYVAGGMYLFRQNADRTFADASGSVGLAGLERLDLSDHDSAIPAYMANVCDIDNDGNMDLLISGYGRRWNKLMFNRGGKYQNDAASLKFDADDNGRQDFRGNGNSFTATCGDVDRDGKLDVFQGEITHEWAGPTSDLSSLLYNRYPQPFVRFNKFPRPTQFANQGDIGSALGDIDLDGVLDLVIANADYPPETTMLIFGIKADGKMTNESKVLGQTVVNPKGTVLFDFDRDGDLDLVTGENQMRGHDPRVRFFKSNVQENSPTGFINLVLQGDGQGIPESPVGARVSITNSPVPMVREMVFGGGQDAQGPLEAHFGLGEFKNLARVDMLIRWNNRHSEKLTLDTNKTYKVVFKAAGSQVTVIK